MKFIFDKDELNRAVTPAMGSVSTKATLPAIEGILFSSTSDNECEITTYDLEKGYKTKLPCRVEREGSFIINASKINQIIKAMPSGDITVEISDKLQCRIYSGKSEFELHILESKEFPAIPELAGEKGLTIVQKTLASMMNEAQFAIAINDPRVALNGLYFKIQGTSITIVSCDGNRLALREKVCDVGNLNKDGSDLALSFILPGKTISELMRLIDTKDDEKTVRILVGRKHVIFAFEDFYLFSRIIEGEYIDYDRFIPKNNRTFVNINRDSFVQSLDRASIVTEDRTMGQAKPPVKLTFEESILKITTTPSVSGRVYDEVAMSMTGDGIEIGFNCRYLLDALRSTTVDTLKLSMSSPLMSMIIEAAEPQEDDRFLFLVLPCKMKE
ncbi:MAG: DNA polymerase III subunit beta [Oscillospiraceae bacterium]|nr:DNA polymerase III subunit beta [Oscillospiraceae bacterium]